jgi:hypothetical protein
MTFGGVEALLVPWLTSTLGVRAVTETPDNLADVVPINKVDRIGGGAYPRAGRLIFPSVVVASFAKGNEAADKAAQDVVDAMLGLLPNQTITGSTVTGVVLNSGPVKVPYPDTVLRQRVSTFDLVIQTA